MVKRLFIATLVAIGPLYALAQGLITGHIKDARNGESLIGASVIVKSERLRVGERSSGMKGQGVVTDYDGNFSLQTKVEPPLTLRVEYVGYRPLDVDVYEPANSMKWWLWAMVPRSAWSSPAASRR